jgi:iron complex outermembrane recepter protein
MRGRGECMGLFPSRLIACALMLLTAAASHAQRATSDPPPPGHIDNPVAIELPDSLGVVYRSSEEDPLELRTIEVNARRVTRSRAADRIRLSPGLLETRDAASVAELGALLPSTQLNVNSRGEALFLVRGSSERHLAVELDGVPLTIPWDERSDLSMIPLVGVGSVEAQRGVGSVLDPPNALAGMVRMYARRQNAPGSHTRVGTNVGEIESVGAQLLHERRDGNWQTMLAVEHREREGFLLPKNYVGEVHQPGRRARLNTDLRQNSLLFDLRRRAKSRAGWGVTVQASEGEKGIAPEDHLVDARFWRYPKRDRFLSAFHASIDSNATSAWSFDALGSIDLFQQDIRPYDDSSYQTPTLTSGVDFEADRDRTVLTRLGATRHGEAWTWRSRGRLRHGRHLETLVVDGPETEYQQNLGALGVEGEWHGREEWSVRGGLGYEASSTPRTGDKASRGADHELSAQFAVEQRLNERSGWHASYAHRPRFASLREMFSGALGRFQVNPSLRPERQDSIELGASWSDGRFDLMTNVFAQHLDGAIERVGVPGSSLRQRVNLDAILNAGVEVGVLWRPLVGLSFDWQHTFLRSRRKVDGSFNGRVEDRPDWLSTLALDYVHRVGFRGRIEAVGVGPRYSLDDRLVASAERLTRLDSDIRTNLRLSWRYFGRRTWFEGAEVFVRAENLFDEITYSQLGLAQAGRSARIGLRFDLRS